MNLVFLSSTSSSITTASLISAISVTVGFITLFKCG